MGKQKKSNIKKKKKKNSGSNNAAVAEGGGGLSVDPARVRFQYSKIRPVFSGCGRSVEGTLEEIRQKRLQPSELPPIQVIVGSTEGPDEEPWYFSLNNRRLWVLKRCREEGLLPNNKIYVRVRKPKSEKEALRYSLDNCVLEAKIISEKPRQRNETKEQEEDEGKNDLKTEEQPSESEESDNESERKLDGKEQSDDESSDDNSSAPVSNRFSALF
jgi:hypothetical protein